MSSMVMVMFGFMVATVVVLAVGLGAMVVGGSFNERYGNKLMCLRVGLQTATIVLLGVLFLLGSG